MNDQDMAKVFSILRNIEATVDSSHATAKRLVAAERERFKRLDELM